MANELNIFCDCDIPRDDLAAFAHWFEQLTDFAVSEVKVGDNPFANRPCWVHVNDEIALYLQTNLQGEDEIYDDFPFYIRIRHRPRQVANIDELTEANYEWARRIFDTLKAQENVRLLFVDEADFEKVLASFGGTGQYDRKKNQM